ncbi:L-alanyl-gamma-D-glutamyl-meso-diaminopimelate ligase, partial [Vibrio parahaemolyticus VPTS-2010]
RASPYGN